MKKICMFITVVAISIVTAISSNAKSDILPIKERSSGMTCSCSAWNGVGCRADYWGSQCAPDSSGDCTRYDRNCSNTGSGGNGGSGNGGSSGGGAN